MGRATYDFIARDASPYAYGNQRVIVVTSRPLDDPKGPLEVRRDVYALTPELRALDYGDVWVLGGGRPHMAFLERGALDEFEVFVLPEVLGAGKRLFPAMGFRACPTRASAQALDKACVRLHYGCGLRCSDWTVRASFD